MYPSESFTLVALQLTLVLSVGSPFNIYNSHFTAWPISKNNKLRTFK